jgi:hypothetical protein
MGIFRVKSVGRRKLKGERQRDEDRDVMRKEKNISKKERSIGML